MMRIYGALVSLSRSYENARVIGDKMTTFKCSENIANHFQLRDTIDTHNSKRYDRNTYNSISLEIHGRKFAGILECLAL